VLTIYLEVYDIPFKYINYVQFFTEKAYIQTSVKVIIQSLFQQNTDESQLLM
jgi:hypothetical protein